VVVHLQEGAQPPAGALHLGGRSWRVPVADADAAITTALALDGRPGVTAFPDVLLPRERTGVDFDDPDHGGQWYLETLGMQPLYERSLGDAASRVAVLDSGIDIAHPDLVDAVDAPYDAFSDDADPSPNPGEYCYGGGGGICDDHGTAVSGVVAARANNGEGIVGLCPECTLVPVKLLGEPQTGSLSENVRAFEHAIAEGVGVINNSWGFTSSIPVPSVLEEVIIRAHEEPRGGLGALVVFAAGNDNREISDDEMQAMPEVLCVSATDSYGRYTNYTNSGASVDVSAPSATVTLAAGGGTTTTFGGTSAAAPVVSGLAGWALSIRPDLSADELQQMLIDSAVPSPLVTHDEDGHHPIFGYGQVDPAALWEALEPGASDPAADSEAPDEDAPKGGCSTLPAAPGLGFGGIALLGALARRGRTPGWIIGARRVKVG
jgi:subtilisin family serine protease